MLNVTVSGFLRTDPTVKQTQRGDDYLEFSIPHRTRQDDPKNPQYKLSQWVRVQIFGQRAKYWLDKYNQGAFGKGVFVVVTGQLEVSIWESNNGPQASLSVTADNIDASLQAQSSGRSNQPNDPDDVPF